jgi:flagellar capping protein FliD
MEIDLEVSELIKDIISEARNPNLTYTQKEVSGKLDRVIVELSGRESEKFTKLAKSFKRTKTQIERLVKVQDALNAEVKKEAIDLFDAQDEVMTRVVNTVSLGITISKKPEVKDTIKTDWEQVAKGIMALTPELDDKIKELIEQFTTVKAGVPKDVSLRVDIKEGVISDAFGKLLGKLKSFLNSIKSWGSSYDSKLEKLKSQL